mmetsp:Transcript_90199/g.280840  ORF Transcript_90199/g.280840 Transcript_90199/m.280840 type:complete len:348 (-) Transcript_90199:662-1705(-)
MALLHVDLRFLAPLDALQQLQDGLQHPLALGAHEADEHGGLEGRHTSNGCIQGDLAMGGAIGQSGSDLLDQPPHAHFSRHLLQEGLLDGEVGVQGEVGLHVLAQLSLDGLNAKAPHSLQHRVAPRPGQLALRDELRVQPLHHPLGMAFGHQLGLEGKGLEHPQVNCSPLDECSCLDLQVQVAGGDVELQLHRPVEDGYLPLGWQHVQVGEGLDVVHDLALGGVNQLQVQGRLLQGLQALVQELLDVLGEHEAVGEAPELPLDARPANGPHDLLPHIGPGKLLLQDVRGVGVVHDELCDATVALPECSRVMASLLEDAPASLEAVVEVRLHEGHLVGEDLLQPVSNHV